MPGDLAQAVRWWAKEGRLWCRLWSVGWCSRARSGGRVKCTVVAMTVVVIVLSLAWQSLILVGRVLRIVGVLPLRVVVVIVADRLVIGVCVVRTFSVVCRLGFVVLPVVLVVVVDVCLATSERVEYLGGLGLQYVHESRGLGGPIGPYDVVCAERVLECRLQDQDFADHLHQLDILAAVLVHELVHHELICFREVTGEIALDGV
jgi:hypothetical protein